jgi:hypothetical protein
VPAIAEVFVKITGKVCQSRGFTVIKILVLNQGMAVCIPKSFLHRHWGKRQSALSEFPAILRLTNSLSLPGSLTCG